jgi:hypothetical protein
MVFMAYEYLDTIHGDSMFQRLEKTFLFNLSFPKMLCLIMPFKVKHRICRAVVDMLTDQSTFTHIS